MIDDLLQLQHEQEEIDRWYMQLVEVYHSQMASFYRKFDNRPKIKRTFFIAQNPWWTDKLRGLAKITHKAEKAYVKAIKSGKGIDRNFLER